MLPGTACTKGLGLCVQRSESSTDLEEEEAQSQRMLGRKVGILERAAWSLGF